MRYCAAIIALAILPTFVGCTSEPKETVYYPYPQQTVVYEPATKKEIVIERSVPAKKEAKAKAKAKAKDPGSKEDKHAKKKKKPKKHHSAGIDVLSEYVQFA